MRNLWKLFAVSIAVLPVAYFAQDQPVRPQDKSDAAKAAEVRFSPDMLDKSIDPCNDFYAYACSKWQAQNPIPADRSSWGRFNELQQRGEYIVRDILEKAAVDTPGRSANEQKIGDYYASLHGRKRHREGGHQAAGARLPEHRRAASRSTIFRRKSCACTAKAPTCCSASVPAPTSRMPARSSPKSIRADSGMPDRDYYFKDDAEVSRTARRNMSSTCRRCLSCWATTPDKAAAEAKVVMDIETGLAKGALDQTSRRDPQKIYHKLSNQELAALSPGFNWNVYFEGVGAPKFDSLNVVEPDFVKQMQTVVRRPLARRLEDLSALARGARQRPGVCRRRS